MNEVRIDSAARRAHVGPGATLGDLDRETQAFGLAVPTGINSTTGIAGLTLGGGFGWLSRKHGITVDALRAADVVTAEGSLIHTNESEHPDLFWAIRGGGGNFGPESVHSTAYSHRDANYVLNVHGRWTEPSDDARCIGWARDFFAASEPYATGGVYVNFMTADETERVTSAFGANYDRLVEVKKKYDPNNRFRMNQNISPQA